MIAVPADPTPPAAPRPCRGLLHEFRFSLDGGYVCIHCGTEARPVSPEAARVACPDCGLVPEDEPWCDESACPMRKIPDGEAARCCTHCRKPLASAPNGGLWCDTEGCSARNHAVFDVRAESAPPRATTPEPSNFDHLRELVGEAKAALCRVEAPSSPEQDRDGLYYPLLFLTEQVEATLRTVLANAYESVREENEGAARWLAEARDDHSHHGRGDADNGPDDPDCACRGTAQQATCAQAGCGFCRVASRARERFARWEPDGRWVCECGAKSCGADFPGPTSCCFTLRPERAPLAAHPATTPEPMTEEWLAETDKLFRYRSDGDARVVFLLLEEVRRLRAPLAGSPSLESGALLDDEVSAEFIAAMQDAPEPLEFITTAKRATLERDAARMREAATRFLSALNSCDATKADAAVVEMRAALSPSGEPTTTPET